MRMSEPVRAAIRTSTVAYVASADAQGRPHLAVSKLIRVLDAERVTFTGWFCPMTAENVETNRNVAIAVWDASSDHGYQLLGRVVGSAVTAVLNGVDDRAQEFSSLPQEERKLTVQVDAVLELKSGVHSDDSV